MRTAFFSIVASDGQLLANQGTLHVGLGHAQAHDEVHFAGLAGLADFQVAAQGHVQVGVGGIPAGSGSCEQSRKLRISVTRIENGPAPFSNMAWFLL